MWARCMCPHLDFIDYSMPAEPLPLGLDRRSLRPSSIAETKDSRIGLMKTQAADGYTLMQGRSAWPGIHGKRSPSVPRPHTHIKASKIGHPSGGEEGEEVRALAGGLQSRSQSQHGTTPRTSPPRHDDLYARLKRRPRLHRTVLQ